ncbi:MAG TPA: YdbL family protein [Alphaproteobacteria bacterium]|nr:YdbL family protein [Alphaproteobacteria bacterium]HNS44219.1 YdbL family protein [Alphaproteobacteria bacterium]
MTLAKFSRFLLTVFSVVFLSAVAMAGDMDLVSAKRAGLIGETSDGLVAATLPNPSPEVTSLVNNTNRGRMVVYKQTAAKETIPVAEVQKIAAQKMFSMATKGELLMVGGQWVQKK